MAPQTLVGLSGNSDVQDLAFRTYVNYLGGLGDYLTREYKAPRSLLEPVVKCKEFREIQGGRCKNLEAAKHLLHNSWFTEIQMQLPGTHMKELVPYHNHWAPVQLYYCVYLGIRALFTASGYDVAPRHPATLNAIAGMIKDRAELFPQPWRTLCRGDPYYKTETYPNIPNGINVDRRFSCLAAIAPELFWDSYGMFLRTTRACTIKEAVDKWRKRNKRKRMLRPQRDPLVDAIRETTIFDILYRLRIRSNYEDADLFLLTLESQSAARRFNWSQRQVVWYTMLLLELLVARYLGKSTFGGLAKGFEEYEKGGYSRQLISKRWDILSQAL